MFDVVEAGTVAAVVDADVGAAVDAAVGADVEAALPPDTVHGWGTLYG